MKWPTVAEVSNELRRIRAAQYTKGEEPLDVRLQVYESGDWVIRFGDPQHDLDHNGYWGSSSVSYEVNVLDVARELLSQAKESAS